MTKRRKFAPEFKAKVALDALRGDKTTQEIATKYKVHPNQVSTWKCHAVDGLDEVFSNGADRGGHDHEAEVHGLHAKIGQLTVERNFWPKGSSDEPGGTQDDDPARSLRSQFEPSMRPAFDQPVVILLRNPSWC